MFSSLASWSTLKRRQPASSRSEPSASTSMALRNRCRSPGLMRTFTQRASMPSPWKLVRGRSDAPRGPAGDLGVEIEGPRAHRRPAGHRPEDLELEPVGILGVEGEADPVIRLADERARVEQALARAAEVGDLAHLPRRVIHARHLLVGSAHTGLLKEAQVVIVGRAGNLQEGRVGIALGHLEAEELAVEMHAALHVRHPEDEVLQALETDARRAHRALPGTSTLTVMAAQAMMVSAPGTRRPPATACTVTSPWGNSRFTTATSTAEGSGTATVTSTSMVPPRSRTSVNNGRLECRMASDTARQAALVASRPCTSTPIPNSSTCGFAVTEASCGWCPAHPSPRGPRLSSHRLTCEAARGIFSPSHTPPGRDQ